MTATTRFLCVLLLAATALAEDPPAACPDQTAAMGTCGLGDAMLTCPICIATSMGTDATATIDPSNTDAIAAMCDTMKSGNFCSDLDKCVEEKCPETCKGPIKELAACTLKAAGCDIDCAADGGAPSVDEGDDSSAYGRTSLLTTAAMCLGSLGAMNM